MSLTSASADTPISTGLTADEARRRLTKFGPNAMPDTALNPVSKALAKFWAVLFLAPGLVMTRRAILTPMLMAIIRRPTRTASGAAWARPVLASGSSRPPLSTC